MAVSLTGAPPRRGLHVTLWVVQVLLALLFLFAGAMKFIMPIEEMTKQMPSMSGTFLHFIGVCEQLYLNGSPAEMVTKAAGDELEKSLNNLKGLA